MAEEPEELSPKQRLIEELRHCRVGGQDLEIDLHSVYFTYSGYVRDFEESGNRDMATYYRALVTAVGTLKESPVIRTMKVKDEDVIDRVIEALPEAKTIDNQFWKEYTRTLAERVFVIVPD